MTVRRYVIHDPATRAFAAVAQQAPLAPGWVPGVDFASRWSSAELAEAWAVQALNGRPVLVWPVDDPEEGTPPCPR